MIAQNFVMDYALAKAQGVSQSEALKLAFVASPFRPFFGMIMAFALAREEAPPPTPVLSAGPPGFPIGYPQTRLRGLFRRRLLSPPGPPAAVAAAPAVSPGLQQLQQAVATAGLPSFQWMDKAQAQVWAQLLNLTLVFEGPVDTGRVEWQEPAPGKQPKDNTLKLKLK